jgi:hypothetical protein
MNLRPDYGKKAAEITGRIRKKLFAPENLPEKEYVENNEQVEKASRQKDSFRENTPGNRTGGKLLFLYGLYFR